jgi:MFS family permease
VGLFGLVPLVLLGLYGGAIVDAHDRRTVALVSGVLLWTVSLATAAQAWLGMRSVPLLYLLVAAQAAAFAVNNPARSTIIPALVRRELLPAANALSMLTFQLGFAIGPLLGGFLVGRFGFKAAYTVDAVTYLAALTGIWRLPSLPPQGEPRRAGLRSVLEGLRFLGTRPNVRMTFLVDLAAMVLAQPRALFPAIGAVVLGGGATTAGALMSGIAVGAIASSVFSGPLGHVRRQGAAVLACVTGWGLAVAGFGAVCLVALLGRDGTMPGPGISAGSGAGSGPAASVLASGVSASGVSASGGSASGVSWLLWPALLALALSGAADAVSSVFRSTILQSATPDSMRGRLQGVFIVVVAGGPRLGDLVAGSGGSLLGEPAAAIAGGLACVLAVAGLARWQPRFARYDAAHPEP